jgi:O-acetyl-ADP-ribose deacetylase (regulator of RNase III)
MAPWFLVMFGMVLALGLIAALVYMLRLRPPPRASGPPQELWASSGSGLTRRVILGDALDIEGPSVLVIPANRQLNLDWGSHLAERLAEKAGTRVGAEAVGAHPEGIALGEAVLTGAGDLKNYQMVIHAAVLDMTDMNPLFLLRLRPRTSRATLRAAVTASLNRAAAAGLRSLVLTPMGAGIGGLSDIACAEEIRQTLDAWEEAHPEGGLDEVWVACIDPLSGAAFRVEFARAMGEEEPPADPAGTAATGPQPSGPPPTP